MLLPCLFTPLRPALGARAAQGAGGGHTQRRVQGGRRAAQGCRSELDGFAVLRLAPAMFALWRGRDCTGPQVACFATFAWPPYAHLHVHWNSGVLLRMILPPACSSATVRVRIVSSVVKVQEPHSFSTIKASSWDRENVACTLAFWPPRIGTLVQSKLSKSSCVPIGPMPEQRWQRREDHCTKECSAMIRSTTNRQVR